MGGVNNMRQDYHEYSYAKAQFAADLRRVNRLQFCFPEEITGCRIVSLGSGPAVDIQFLLPNNEVHAIDIMDEPLREAASRGIHTHKIDLDGMSRLPFSDQSMDVVIATDILEHLLNPLKALTETRRILRNQGFALISVPNHFFWSMRLHILKGGDLILPFHKTSKQWDYFHIRFFNSEGFEELVEESRLRIVERYYDRFISVPRGLPEAIDRRISRRFPDLFSMHFMLKATRA